MDRLREFDNLRTVVRLKNRYAVMRHGYSEANAADVLVGDPERGTGSFGVTPEGMKAVLEALQAFRDSGGVRGEDLVVVSSDFLRTAQTARAAAEILGSGTEVVLTSNLRERQLGELEGRRIDELEEIYARDLVNPLENDIGAEPLSNFVDRLTREVVSLEERFSGKFILLVSHRDPIQMLGAAFSRICLEEYRSVAPPPVASIRVLELREADESTGCPSRPAVQG